METLLFDIGVCPNLESIATNPARLDVMSLMIFTLKLELIISKIYVCLDGKWINILVVEEISVSMEDREVFLMMMRMNHLATWMSFRLQKRKRLMLRTQQ